MISNKIFVLSSCLIVLLIIQSCRGKEVIKNPADLVLINGVVVSF